MREKLRLSTILPLPQIKTNISGHNRSIPEGAAAICSEIVTIGQKIASG
jgi:hypothetical protein